MSIKKNSIFISLNNLKNKIMSNTNELHGVHPGFSEYQEKQKNKTPKEYAQEYIDAHGPVKSEKNENFFQKQKLL